MELGYIDDKIYHTIAISLSRACIVEMALQLWTTVLVLIQFGCVELCSGKQQ